MSYTKAQNARDWQFIWATPEGQRAISALLASNGFFSSTIDPNPTTMAFNEGRRNVALDIVQMLAIPPNEFKVLTEAVQELEND